METNALQLSETAQEPVASSADSAHSIQSGLYDAGLIAGLTAFQFLWLALFSDIKLALINLFPAAVFIAVWTLFINRHYSHRTALRNWLLLPVVLLTLRLHITLFDGLQFVNWALCLVVVGVVCAIS